MNYTRADFGADFQWGVSTAAYQIEGAYASDGKGPSIWDVFTARKGKIAGNTNGNIAVDFYNRYKDDIDLLKQLNISNFRFSISWSRIMPSGNGKLNPGGVDFYNRLIDYCLESGIEPWVTLYHWDLPAALEKKGGWTNRDIIGWFSGYVDVCIRLFGDRVKNWMILNEPLVFTGAGYFFGVHAPGRKGLNNFLAAVHHAAICQAEGGRIARSIEGDLNIGTTFSCSHIDPHTLSATDLLAAKKVDALLNRTFIEPLLGMGYPLSDLPFLRRIESFIRDGDEQRLKFQPDFIGLQNYTREIVCSSFFTPYMRARIIKADRRRVHKTVMNWEVYPESIYMVLKKFNAYSGVKQIIVTENGSAFPDVLKSGRVDDPERLSYLQKYIQQVLRAKQEGINVAGYFVWSFTDNFEWAEGYYPRFGLVYIDYPSQQRIVKSSGYWYKDLMNS